MCVCFCWSLSLPLYHSLSVRVHFNVDVAIVLGVCCCCCSLFNYREWELGWLVLPHIHSHTRAHKHMHIKNRIGNNSQLSIHVGFEAVVNVVVVAAAARYVFFRVEKSWLTKPIDTIYPISWTYSDVFGVMYTSIYSFCFFFFFFIQSISYVCSTFMHVVVSLLCMYTLQQLHPWMLIAKTVLW